MKKTPKTRFTISLGSLNAGQNKQAKSKKELSIQPSVHCKLFPSFALFDRKKTFSIFFYCECSSVF